MGRGLIKNCKEDNGNLKYDKSKKIIGKIYKYEYENNEFISTGKHFFDKVESEQKILSKEIAFSYINEIYRYSLRNRRFFTRDSGYIANRSLNAFPTMYKKCTTISKCINKKIEGIEFDKVLISFEDDIDYQYKSKEEKLKEYSDILSKIEKNLYITNGTQVRIQNNKKILYIQSVYSKYIMDMIINQLFSVCELNKQETVNIKHTKNINFSVEISKLVEYIKKLKLNQSSEELLGKAVNFQEEILLIEKVSGQLKGIFSEKKTTYLKLLARYVGSRLNSDQENSKFRYVDGFEEMMDSLLEIPEVYFNKESIKIPVSDFQEKSIGKLLEVYDKYANTENFHTDIHAKFKISFKGLSEGEERLVDIISKIEDSIKENKEAKLLILLFDEPDQSLHPEWSRCFIDIITQVIESIEFKGNIQLILSTHSPYLLSDILPGGILKLQRESNAKGRILKVFSEHDDMKHSGLGANIYDLMQNEFFMKNTVGEFATKKINGYIRKIYELTRNSEDIQEIEYFIEQVGEPIIKKGMERQLEAAKYKLNLKENDNKLLDMITDECDRKKVKAYLQTIREQL